MIHLKNEQNYALDIERVRQAIQATLDEHDIDAQSEVTVVITDDEAVRELNRDYRQVDAPTDVLSFPADPLPEEIADELPYLGDLIMAYPYTKARAEREGHNIDETFMLLAVHGTLHLLGYDHETAEEYAEMWEVQKDILGSLGVSPAILPALEDFDSDDSK